MSPLGSLGYMKYVTTILGGLCIAAASCDNAAFEANSRLADTTVGPWQLVLLGAGERVVRQGEDRTLLLLVKKSDEPESAGTVEVLAVNESGATSASETMAVYESVDEGRYKIVGDFTRGGRWNLTIASDSIGTVELSIIAE